LSHPLHLTGIAGSLRASSYSRAVLQSWAELLPAGSRYSWLEIGDLPHYNEDLDHDQPPAAVAAGRALIGASDGVLIVTPEFNHGLPGVLKNTLDWLSRPAFKSCFAHKPVLFATHSPGALGGVRTQYQLRETLAAMLCQLVPVKEVAIPLVADKISDGRLTAEAQQRYLEAPLAAFLAQLRRP